MYMKNCKKLSTGVAVVSLVLIGSANAFAVALGDSGSGVNVVGTYQTGQGGEFLFNATSGTVNNSSYAAVAKNIDQLGSFQTFCLEVGEYLSSPVTYVVNDEAVLGGNNSHLPSGNQGGDTLSQGTAWLYSQFAQGLLAGYNFSGTTAQRKTSAGLLQNAIWALEDENPDPAPLGNAFFDLALLHGGEANYTSGQYGVYVLNNTQGTTKAQDMLFYSTGGIPAPDGGTSLMLLGFALGGMSLLRRCRLFNRE